MSGLAFDDDDSCDDEHEADDDYDENHHESGILLLTPISDSSTVNIIGSQINNSNTSSGASYSKGYKGCLTVHHLNPRNEDG